MLGIIIIRRRDSAPSLMKSAKSFLAIRVWSECVSSHMPKTQDDFKKQDCWIWTSFGNFLAAGQQ